jgi:hypothetical protein
MVCTPISGGAHWLSRPDCNNLLGFWREILSTALYPRMSGLIAGTERQRGLNTAMSVFLPEHFCLRENIRNRMPGSGLLRVPVTDSWRVTLGATDCDYCRGMCRVKLS